MPALIALREVGLEPLELQAKEGLALLNGTQLMGAIGALLLADADRLVRTASVVAAMSVEALLGTDVAFAAAYQLARPHPGQVAVAAELRHLLRDSELQRSHHASAHKVQDPYSLRCVPQVHGAVRDALDHLRRVLDIELNSATDNPLVFPGGGVADADTIATGGGRVISGGNFHGEPIALALDFAKLALAELGSISERRTALLVDARLNGGLPPFLAASSGIDSGMMIYQYTAAALASEHKVLAHPASADSIPTSANQEDHVSMGATAARHARHGPRGRRADPRDRVLVATQALDLRLARRTDAPAPGRRGRGGPGRASAAVVAHLEEDRRPGPDLAAATRARPRRRRSPTSPARPRRWSAASAGPSAPPWRRDVVLAEADAPQRRVDLVEVGPALAPLLEPDQVARIHAGDLADRPAEVASERQHAPRRPARRASGAAGPVPAGRSRRTRGTATGRDGAPASCGARGSAAGGSARAPRRRLAPLAARAGSISRARRRSRPPLRIAQPVPGRVDHRSSGASRLSPAMSG